MSLTINRTDRDALYDGLMTDLSAIGDFFIDLHNDEPASAKRLHRRFEVELRLLDDLGWEKEPETEHFELTMPARELRPIIERIYWSAVGSLADSPEELTEKAAYQMGNATSACPEILARLAEDNLLDPEAQQAQRRARLPSEQSRHAARVHRARAAMVLAHPWSGLAVACCDRRVTAAWRARMRA